FQAEDGIRDDLVTGVQTCALPIWLVELATMAATLRKFWIAWNPLLMSAVSSAIAARLATIQRKTTNSGWCGGRLLSMKQWIKLQIGRASCREKEKKRERRGGMTRE